MVSTDGGATYAQATTSPAEVTFKTYTMNGATATTSKTYTIAKDATTTSNSSVKAIYTAKTTLKAENIADGYTFVGWYDVTNGTMISTSATPSAWYPKEAITLEARFSKEEAYPVTISYMCGSEEIESPTTETVGVTTPSVITAPKIKDYTFSSWDLGSGVQSADKNANQISITTKASGDYKLTANYTYIEPNIKTIYCKMEHDWWYSDGAAISAYVWGDEEGELKSAPGALMALAPWESKVWKIDIDIARYPKVCFIRVNGDGSVNWGAQTKDLVIPTDENNLFTISNTTATWGSNPGCDGSWSVYTPSIPDFYLTGNDAGFGMTIDGEGNEKWSPNSIKMTLDANTQKFTHTVSGLEANKYYKFRITDGTWSGKWGYSNLNPTVANVFEAEDNNISFVLSAAGSITIVFDGTNIELTTSSSFAAPVYTLVGDAAITGVHWDVNSVENQMVQDATDKNQFTLVKTVTAVAGEYEYKAIRNHSYDWEVAGDKVKIEKDGTGKITYTLDIATPKLTAKVSDWEEEAVAQVVVLDGIGEQKTFVEAGNKKSTSVDVVLEANKVYDFSVIVNSVYMNNNGSMWRENCTNWAFEHGANRAHIITDLAGTYTFTWTYDGNKLSVKYPDGTNVPAPVFLKGTMNEWNNHSIRLIPSADGKTASVTVTLAKGTYDFGIVFGDDYLSNTGTMDSNNSTGWTFEKLIGDDTGKNAKINASLTGEYTFTWTYGDSKQLSVTYPIVPEMKSGKFSTGKYEYAEFAPGNLQYYTGDKTWRFATNQYDYVGEANINVGDPTYKGWIDMFGWSTDDENNNYGVNPNNVNELYDGNFVDWGTKMGAEWSTLSADQWKYLLNTRDNASSLKQIARVGDMLGIMLFPDEWTLPADCDPVETLNHDPEDGANTKYDFYSQNYTLAQWTELEAAGAIFFPAAGRRAGGYGNMINYNQVEETNPENLNGGHYKHHDNANIYCYYWTSTINESTKDVSYLHNIVALGNDEYTIGSGAIWGEKGRYGQSVRLAKVTSTLITLGNGDNSAVIAANEGQTVNVKLDRAFNNSGWGTLCVPFNMEASVIGEAYELGTITEYTAGEGGGVNLNLSKVDNLEAGKPYLIKANTTSPIIIEDVTIVNTIGTSYEVTGDNIKIVFTGLINSDGNTNGSTEYYVGANDGCLYNAVVAKLGLRALFTITDMTGGPANVRARVAFGENTTTDIMDVPNPYGKTIKVIRNGQLIIIRDGEKYNAQGIKL